MSVTEALLTGQPPRAKIGLASLATVMEREKTREEDIKLPANPDNKRMDRKTGELETNIKVTLMQNLLFKLCGVCSTLVSVRRGP